MRQNSPHPSSALPGRPSRRGFLQGVAAGTVGLAAARLLSSLPVQAAGRQDNGVLILFFSHSGHTRQLAGMIHDRVGGRLVEIRPATPYPGDYDSVVDMARQEQRRKARPGLAGPLPDLTGCGTVFIGFPNWWDTMPMILFTLLEKLDLGNRTVIPSAPTGGAASAAASTIWRASVRRPASSRASRCAAPGWPGPDRPWTPGCAGSACPRTAGAKRRRRRQGHAHATCRPGRVPESARHPASNTVRRKKRT